MDHHHPGHNLPSRGEGEAKSGNCSGVMVGEQCLAGFTVNVSAMARNFCKMDECSEVEKATEGARRVL